MASIITWYKCQDCNYQFNNVELSKFLTEIAEVSIAAEYGYELCPKCKGNAIKMEKCLCCGQYSDDIYTLDLFFEEPCVCYKCTVYVNDSKATRDYLFKYIRKMRKLDQL